MEAELRERFGDEAVCHLRALLSDFVERHGGAEELAANRARATERSLSRSTAADGRPAGHSSTSGTAKSVTGTLAIPSRGTVPGRHQRDEVLRGRARSGARRRP